MCYQIQEKKNVPNKKNKMKRIKKSRKKIGKRELPEEILQIISEFSKPIGFITQCRGWSSQGRINMKIFLDGYKRKIGYMSILPPVQRKLIEYIINENTGSPRYWNDYTSDINIARIGNNAENFTDVSYKVTLQEAYPSIVGEVALTHSGGSEVLRLPVTFKFKKWISIL